MRSENVKNGDPPAWTQTPWEHPSNDTHPSLRHKRSSNPSPRLIFFHFRSLIKSFARTLQNSRRVLRFRIPSPPGSGSCCCILSYGDGNRRCNGQHCIAQPVAAAQGRSCARFRCLPRSLVQDFRRLLWYSETLFYTSGCGHVWGFYIGILLFLRVPVLESVVGFSDVFFEVILVWRVYVVGNGLWLRTFVGRMVFLRCWRYDEHP